MQIYSDRMVLQNMKKGWKRNQSCLAMCFKGIGPRAEGMIGRKGASKRKSIDSFFAESFKF